MTLVMSHTCGGLYSVMTSDTRQVTKQYWYDTVTGEYIDRELPLEVREDIRAIKTERVSYFTLIGTAGTGELCNYIKEKLREEVQFGYDLTQCKEALQRVIARERENTEGPNYLKFLEIENGLVLSMTGFYAEDGTLGVITYESGVEDKFSEKKLGIGDVLPTLITPAKEYQDNAAEIMAIPNMEDGLEGLPFMEIQHQMIKRSVNHMAGVHKHISDHHPVEVSPEIEIFILRKDLDGRVIFDHLVHDFSKE